MLTQRTAWLAPYLLHFIELLHVAAALGHQLAQLLILILKALLQPVHVDTDFCRFGYIPLVLKYTRQSAIMEE